MVSGSGICAKVVLVDARHHMLGRLAPLWLRPKSSSGHGPTSYRSMPCINYCCIQSIYSFGFSNEEHRIRYLGLSYLILLKMKFSWMNLAWLGFFLTLGVVKETLGIRIFEGNLDNGTEKQHQYKVAVFALGSFWRGEAVFGCLPGVIRTTAGYSGGTKINPEYRILGDHAEAVQKFELRRSSVLLQLLGMLPDEEFASSSMATKLNSYAAGMCPPSIQKAIDAKVNDFLKSWPLWRVFQEV